ncbi:MAG: redoxin domain-containing protein [Bacteroidia bacterium]
MSTLVGQKAPLFSLKDSDKNLVNLADYKGKNVVLLFFPAAFTGTCTKELCQTRDELSYYNDLNAVVFGISVDMPFTLAKFKEMNNYNFQLLSDFNKEASTAYNCIYKEWIHGLRGVSKRASFVIDKEGVVRFEEILEDAGSYPNFDALKDALNKLK